MRRPAVAIALAVAVGASLFVTQANARPVASLDDATIVAILDAANAADVETGALAAKQADSKEVREYGQMLAQVHTHVLGKTKELAQKLKVTPTPPKDDQAAKDHAAVMARLRPLTGAAFDKAFLAHEKAYHQAVLDAVKTAIVPAIKNQELKDFVVSLGPAFEAHRLQAENLERKLQGK